jgi:hypothetical protein
MMLCVRRLRIGCIFLTLLAFAGCTNTPPNQTTVKIFFPSGGAYTIDNGQTVTITAETVNDNGAGVSWTCSGSACAAATNLSSTSNTSVKFTATTIGTAIVTATSVKTHGVTESVTITVTAPPSLPGGTLGAATTGVAYNQSVGETGGAGALTFTITAGSLPAGLALNATTGIISGTPNGITFGQFSFTVMVKDSGMPNLTATAQYAITVQLPPGSLMITTSSPLPAGAIGAAYSTTISATGGTSPYTFSIDTGGTQLPAGLSLSNSNNQGVISGTPSAAGTFTNILVDVHDSQQPTANMAQTAFSLTITAAPVVVSPASGALPNATQGVAYSESITATGGTVPYIFSLDQSSAALPNGLSFSATGTGATISGTPTAVGTTTGIVVDVKDSSVGAVTQQLTYSLTVASPCGSGNESLLNGQYALLVKGFDNGSATGESGPQPVLMGGTLYLDGAGNVVAGDFDANNFTSHGVQESSVAGTYQIGSDQRGCMTLTDSAGTQNFRIAVAGISAGLASKAHVIEVDATGPFTSGVLLQQDTSAFSTARISGNYVFEISAPQSTASSDGGKQASAGVISLAATDANDGTVSGGTMDLNVEGQLEGSSSNTSWSSATPITISTTGSSYYIGGGIGNIIFNMTVNGNAVQVQDQIYIVSANQLLVMSGADETQSGLIFGGGEALKQSTGAFSTGSLNATSVLHDSALQVGGSSPVVTTTIGTITGNGSGTLNFKGWQNNGSSVQNSTWTGTVQVAGSGRVTFSSGGGTSAAVLWLANNNQGFYLGSGSNVESGYFEPQTSTSVSTGSPYAFGSADPELAGTDQEVGVATLSGGNIAGTIDDNLNGTVTVNTPLSLTYSVDGTGLGSIPAGCTVGTIGAGGCQQVFYVISPTKAVLMNLQNGQGQVTNTPNQVADQ